MKTTIENIKRNITIARLVALFVFMLVSSNVSAQENKKAVLVSNEISTSVSTETSVAYQQNSFLGLLEIQKLLLKKR